MIYLEMLLTLWKSREVNENVFDRITSELPLCVCHHARRKHVIRRVKGFRYMLVNNSTDDATTD